MGESELKTLQEKACLPSATGSAMKKDRWMRTETSYRDQVREQITTWTSGTAHKEWRRLQPGRSWHCRSTESISDNENPFLSDLGATLNCGSRQQWTFCTKSCIYVPKEHDTCYKLGCEWSREQFGIQLKDRAKCRVQTKNRVKNRAGRWKQETNQTWNKYKLMHEQNPLTSL